MANGIWTILELPPVTGRIAPFSGGGEVGERFDWTSDTTPIDPRQGGARAAPLETWAIGTALRTVKTWYPGATTPSEQVLGPEYKPQVFRGTLDDRYNFPGYARATKRRFEAMVERGNLVRISYQDEAWEGIIVDLDMSRRRAWQIPYTFTLSPHGRPEHRSLGARSPQTVKNPTQLVAGIGTRVEEAASAHLLAPTGFLGGSVADDATSRMADLGVSSNKVGEILDAIFGKAGLGRLTGDFGRLAAQVRDVEGIAFDVVESLGALRSDVDVVTRTAMSVLDFEGWSRSLRFQLRVLMGDANTAAAELEERESPSAERIYQPRAGELLYGISQRFYGTPHAWRLIADRNRIRYFKMLGTETLVIPERGEG